SMVQLFIALAVMAAMVAWILVWSFRHPGMRVFGIIALAFPLFLIVFVLVRVRAARRNGRGPR
ncbi:MAG: hypothetical protein WBA09_06090, partial [Candidatus Acidiferrum sp.]